MTVTTRDTTREPRRDSPRRTELGLAPLQAALVTRARAEAGAMVSAAEAEGQAALATAQAQADTLLADARRQGEADGADVLAAERAAARRAARSGLLAAQRGVYDELVRQARHTVRTLLDQPGNRSRLESALRRRLGDSVEVVGAPDGGLLARAADGRTIDASVAAVADSALDTVDLEELWTRG